MPSDPSGRFFPEGSEGMREWLTLYTVPTDPLATVVLFRFVFLIIIPPSGGFLQAFPTALMFGGRQRAVLHTAVPPTH